MHRLQAVQCLQEDALVAHGQVAAFGQRDAQVARQIGMFEIRFRVRTRRQQHQAGRLAVGARAQALQHVEQAAVAGGQPLHLHLPERLGEKARDDQPVLQRVAETRRRLRPVTDHPPLPVGRSRDVEGDDVQERAARRSLSDQRAQVARMPQHQRRRQQVGRQQLLRPVGVGHDRGEQLRALRNAGLDAGPLIGFDQVGKDVQRPRPFAAPVVAVNVVGDAIVAHLTLDGAAAARKIGEPAWTEVRKELAPRPPQRAVRCPQLVVMARRRGRGQPRHQRRSIVFRIEFEQRLSHLRRRRPAPTTPISFPVGGI